MVQEKWDSRASILVLEEKRGCFIGSKDGDGHLGAFVRRGDSIFFVSASADGSDRISRERGVRPGYDAQLLQEVVRTLMALC
jgi:hypothetical protein